MLREAIVRQFGKPQGLFGWAIGRLMAVKNAPRGRFVLDLLAPQAGERILEVGFGPGADLARALARVGPGGRLSGVDLSAVMVRQASRRNRAAVKEGRATLVEGSIERLPFADAEYDGAFSINSAQFWPDLGGGLRELARVLRAGGRAVVAVQPRNAGATVADSERWLAKLRAAASDAGLVVERTELGPTAPPVAAVLARKP